MHLFLVASCYYYIETPLFSSWRQIDRPRDFVIHGGIMRQPRKNVNTLNTSISDTVNVVLARRQHSLARVLKVTPNESPTLLPEEIFALLQVGCLWKRTPGETDDATQQQNAALIWLGLGSLAMCLKHRPSHEFWWCIRLALPHVLGWEWLVLARKLQPAESVEALVVEALVSFEGFASVLIVSQRICQRERLRITCKHLIG